MTKQWKGQNNKQAWCTWHTTIRHNKTKRYDTNDKAGQLMMMTRWQSSEKWQDTSEKWQGTSEKWQGTAEK